MNECIEAPRTMAEGYGIVPSGRRGLYYYAHRFAYEWAHGPIPDGLEIHHLCGHRACYNPRHLIAVTRPQHMQLDREQRLAAQRATWAAITHCPQGHLYDEANTYITKKGCRTCRACARERWHRGRH